MMMASSAPPPLTLAKHPVGAPPGWEGPLGCVRLSRGRGGDSWGVGGGGLPPPATHQGGECVPGGGGGGGGGGGKSPSGSGAGIRRLAVVGVGRAGRGDDG